MPRSCALCVVVNSAVRSSGDGKAKSRGDTHAMNCEAGMRERPAKTKENTGDTGGTGG